MADLHYMNMDEVDITEFITLLNSPVVREHLVVHAEFDVEGVREWIADKIQLDAVDGCRVRAILHEGRLVGWCGIQPAENNYEIAIVLDQSAWGMGRQVFRCIMAWGRELGHEELLIHFLHTRPEYRFLRALAKDVYQSEVMGAAFTTYVLGVN